MLMCQKTSARYLLIIYMNNNQIYVKINNLSNFPAQLIKRIINMFTHGPPARALRFRKRNERSMLFQLGNRTDIISNFELFRCYNVEETPASHGFIQKVPDGISQNHIRNGTACQLKVAFVYSLCGYDTPKGAVNFRLIDRFTHSYVFQEETSLQIQDD